MSAQLNYSFDMEIGVEGQIADIRNKVVLSKSAEGVIPFGRVVVLGTDKDNQCKLPSQASDITNAKYTLGVSTSTQAIESSDDTDYPAYKDEATVNVLKNGSVYMVAEDAMTAISDVYVRTTAVSQTQTLVFNADLVTGNKVNGLVDGTAISEVPFDTDNATTLTNLAQAIENASTKVLSATSDGTHTITVVSRLDYDFVLSSFLVTSGASQASATITETVEPRLTSDLGKIRSDSDSGNASLISGLSIAKSASAGQLAMVEVLL
jgi:hypothetical protein